MRRRATQDQMEVNCPAFGEESKKLRARVQKGDFWSKIGVQNDYRISLDELYQSDNQDEDHFVI